MKPRDKIKKKTSDTYQYNHEEFEDKLWTYREMVVDQYDKLKIYPGSNNNKLTINDTGIANIGINSSVNMGETHIKIDDDAKFRFGDDFEIKGEQLKACIKVLQEIAKEKFPEDFI